MKGIQVCSNEGPRPFPRGDNYEIVKRHWRNLKIFFSRTTGPFSTQLGTKHPWVKVIQVCSNEEPFNSDKVNNGFFLLSINIMIIMCLLYKTFFLQVSDVAHRPLVSFLLIFSFFYKFKGMGASRNDRSKFQPPATKRDFSILCIICPRVEK